MSDFTLGQHESRLDALDQRQDRMENSISGLHSKVDTVLTTLAERRGERKTIAMLATAAGGVGSLLISLLLKLFSHS